MEPRINTHTKQYQEPMKVLLGVEGYLHRAFSAGNLKHFISLRASQLNGCAYCIDMHWKDLRALGESEQRLYGLDAWQESPYYTPRERAALLWTEAVTQLHPGHVPDDVYAQVREHFSEQEIVDLTLAVGMINLWNRLAIAMRTAPGHYVSPYSSTTATAASH